MTYLLQHKAPIPDGGEPFWVESVHTIDGTIRMTQDDTKAKRFNIDYLESTVWDWARDYERAKE